MKRRDVVASALTLPTGLALAGCTGDSTADDQTEDGEDGDDADPTETTAEPTTTESQYADAYYSYASLTFGLYDDSDAKLGTALANVSGLQAGQRWKFDALGTDTETTTYVIEAVTAY